MTFRRDHLGEPLDPVVQVVRRPVQPNEEQAFDRGSDGSGRGNQQDSGRFVPSNEGMEMDAHGSEIGRDQDPAIFGSDPQSFWIRRAIRDRAGGRPELYRRLSSEQSFANGGINVSVRLKTDLQAGLGAAAFLARSKRSIMSCGMGYWALIVSKMRS